MVYMGSKTKYAKYIVPIINNYIKENNIQIFVDAFCGGANLADKIECDTVICNDLSPTLIALHTQAQKDFSKIPLTGDKEYWDLAKKEWEKLVKDPNYQSPLPLYIIGAIEWYGSYGGGGFPKSYANDCNGRVYYDERRKNHYKQASTENYKKINFVNGDYRELKLPPQKAIYYCDAPYENTQPYGIQKDFNFKKYFDWLQEISKIYPVFISEQQLPSYLNAQVLWEDEAIRTLSRNNHFPTWEKLFLMDNRKI